MKKVFAGILSGILAVTSIGLCTPSVAEEVKAIFNSVRVSLYGQDIAQWGENYTLANGENVPYSILYKGTTYLPLRKIGELTGKKVGWNGDTNTVYLNSEITNETGLKKLVEKPDKNGNVWTYYLYMSEIDLKRSNYRALVIRDENRRLERIYQIEGAGYIFTKGPVSEDSLKYIEHIVKITDDGIIFTKYIEEGKAVLWKIDFLSDENSQDGYRLEGYIDAEQGIEKTIFWDDYMFCLDGNREKIYAMNMVTKESAVCTIPNKYYCELRIYPIEREEPMEFPLNLSMAYVGSTGTKYCVDCVLSNDNGLKITEVK